MTAPLSTSTPSPSVRTVMGSAIRITSGQTSALISPISAAPASAAPKLSTVKPASRALRSISVAAVITQITSTRATADKLPAAATSAHRLLARFQPTLTLCHRGAQPDDRRRPRGRRRPAR